MLHDQTDNKQHDDAAAYRYNVNLGAALRRRRETSWRVPQLQCGCQDPLYHKCLDAEPLTDHQLDSWSDAAVYLLNDGLTPIVSSEVLRALWRRNRGCDRMLAEHLHRIYDTDNPWARRKVS